MPHPDDWSCTLCTEVSLGTYLRGVWDQLPSKLEDSSKIHTEKIICADPTPD